ncbi:MAG: hypothetical protein AcusKO_41240 [Acuticoccus sp.]
MVDMTDFYSVLQRAVSSLPDGSGPNRRAVYDKARKALLKQLQSFDPPLPSSDVTAQRLALEDAIRKIENEIARQIRTQRALQTAMPTPKGAIRRPAADTVSDAAANAAAARAAEAEREAQRKAEAERARREQAAMLESAVSDATLEDQPLRTAPVPVTQPTAYVEADPAAPHDGDDGRMFEEEAEYEEEALLDEPQQDDIVDGEYDEVDAEEDYEGYADTPPPAAPRAERRTRKDDKRARREEEKRLKAEQRAAQKARRKDTRKAKPPRKERKRGSTLGRAMLPLLLLALLAGAAYAAYTQRAALLAVIDELQQEPGKRSPITVTSREGANKNADRLPTTLDGENTRAVTTTTWPPQGADAAAEAGDGGDGDGETDGATTTTSATRTVGEDVSPFAPQSSATAAEEQAASVENGEAPADAEPADAEEETVAALDEPDTTVDAAPDTAPDTPLTDITASGTQQAVLYEEAAQAGEAGTAVPGGVEWSMVRESIGGGDPEPIIRATAEIPDRSITATLTMRENVDRALPASHLIEIAFDLPDGFEGGGVKNVPGVIMKQSEEARGEALRGAAARVSSGLFWIALSENPQDQAENLRLLRERDWIDIPILYESGRRAILTLRKGSDGLKSVNAAIQAWSPG